MKKIRKIWSKYGLYICLVCCMVGIIGYFANIMFFQNEKDILNVLVLTSKMDSDLLLEEIEEAVKVDVGEEILIKYMDTSGNEANRAIILTWIRAKTVDIIIGEEEQIDFFAENGCLKEIEEQDISGKSYYDSSVIKYDSDGDVIGREDKKHYGIYINRVAGVRFQTMPVISLAVNFQNKENAINVFELYINQK
mgnify:CR=1 FL=1